MKRFAVSLGIPVFLCLFLYFAGPDLAPLVGQQCPQGYSLVGGACVSTFVTGGGSLTTAGAIPYVSATGTLSQDQTANGQLFWDATNHRLGVGTASPSYPLDVNTAASPTYIHLNNGSGAVFLGAVSANLDEQTGGTIRFLPGSALALTLNTNGTGTWANACASAASPAVCATTPVGSAVIAAAATSVVVNDAAVTANSVITVTTDSSLGTRLSVTCNTQSSLTLGTPHVTARSAGTSFTVAVDVAPTTNPLCFNYHIFN